MIGSPPVRKRSLWPREHGAYFQLAVPLVTACVLHAPNVAMTALAAAACLAFLANEPLLVALGHRGPRMRQHDGPRARRRLAILVGGALVSGLLGLVLAPRDARIAAAIAGAPVLAVVALAWRRAEHTVAGEVIAALALTGASAPVAIAGGATLDQALVMWLAWAIGFGATVVSVHRVIARHKGAASLIDGIYAGLFILTTVACIGLASRVPMIAVAAPLAALAAILVIEPPTATRLRAIGVAIVTAAVGSGTVAVLTAIG